MHQMKMSRVFTLIEPACGPRDDLQRRHKQHHDHLVDHGAGLHADVRLHDGRVELFLHGVAKNQGVCDRHSNVDLLDVIVGIRICSGSDTDNSASSS